MSEAFFVPSSAHIQATFFDRVRTATRRKVVTGIRVGEAIALDRTDIDLGSGRLLVRHGKFDKARELWLHPTTLDALKRYQRLRDRAAPVTGTAAFFVSLSGTRLLYCNVHNTSTAWWPGPSSRRGRRRVVREFMT